MAVGETEESCAHLLGLLSSPIVVGWRRSDTVISEHSVAPLPVTNARSCARATA